jgi:hypothetical protein
MLVARLCRDGLLLVSMYRVVSCSILRLAIFWNSVVYAMPEHIKVQCMYAGNVVVLDVMLHSK